jgi:hypothetical protein
MEFLVHKMFNISHQLLKPGGRLVYLYPFDKDRCTLTDKDLIKDERFVIEDFSLNLLQSKFNRYCITMRKK